MKFSEIVGKIVVTLFIVAIVAGIVMGGRHLVVSRWKEEEVKQNKAFQEGKEFGLINGRDSTTCPYQYLDEIRSAWLKGLNEGANEKKKNESKDIQISNKQMANLVEQQIAKNYDMILQIKKDYDEIEKRIEKLEKK